MAPRSRPGPVEVVFESFAAVAGAVLGIWLLWGIRSLILPVAVGALLAYICYPLVSVSSATE
jgi:predicted PurR-regulated permease PerM